MASIGAGGALAAQSAAKAKKQTYTVCKRGCQYRTIQSAVDVSKGPDVIKVKPGKYVEGVIVEGHKHDGLSIVGTGKNPRQVILEGKNAKSDAGLAQNGVEGDKVDNLKVRNLWARNYAANGVFIHEDCNGYLVKDVVASFNRSYGVYAFNCIGGRITESVGYGHGDSAFYIGQTPPQKKPKWTSLDNLVGYENVLGYSGTNSRYVNIHDSAFYNNGVGIVPNTLDSEKFEPTANGVIEDNAIFWNNFNYFLPNSRVRTVSDGLGTVEPFGTIQFPTGVGVVLLGADGWRVRNNEIFGNFKWGVAAISDPFNDGDNAISMNNQVQNNKMGRGGKDTNAVDFFSDGSGKGNCWAGNGAGATFDPGEQPNSTLYPSACPNSIGPGTGIGDNTQFAELATYVTTNPPEKQECSWTKHSHPKYKNYKPLDVKGASCP